jgi:hypothetical protein
VISVANDGGRCNQQPSYQDCGMNDDTGASVAAGSTAYQKAVAFAQCMRSHGIPDFPEPVVQDGGVVIHGGGFGPSLPQNKSARQACNLFLPGLGGGS